MNQPQTPDNEAVDLSPPQEWLYKCDCPQCRVGAHYNKDIAESYRKRGELNNEVARLRKYVEKIEIYSPENEWSQPEWRKLIGSKEEQEEPDTLFKLYQFRIAPAPEEPTIKESLKVEPRLGAEIEVIDTPATYSVTEARHATADAFRYLHDEIQRIDRALNVGEEDSSHNFVEINKLRDEIQKLKEGN